MFLLSYWVFQISLSLYLMYWSKNPLLNILFWVFLRVLQSPNLILHLVCLAVNPIWFTRKITYLRYLSFLPINILQVEHCRNVNSLCPMRMDLTSVNQSFSSQQIEVVCYKLYCPVLLGRPWMSVLLDSFCGFGVKIICLLAFCQSPLSAMN